MTFLEVLSSTSMGKRTVDCIDVYIICLSKLESLALNPTFERKATTLH